MKVGDLVTLVIVGGLPHTGMILDIEKSATEKLILVKWFREDYGESWVIEEEIEVFSES